MLSLISGSFNSSKHSLELPLMTTVQKATIVAASPWEGDTEGGSEKLPQVGLLLPQVDLGLLWAESGSLKCKNYRVSP